MMAMTHTANKDLYLMSYANRSHDELQGRIGLNVAC
jgi:hypothetical protein